MLLELFIFFPITHKQFIYSLQLKPKKVQHETERGMEVMMHNLILLRHLTEISNSKRVNDGLPIQNRQRTSWNGYYDTILNMRRLQLEDMRQILLEGGNIDNLLETNDNPASPDKKVTFKIKSTRCYSFFVW